MLRLVHGARASGSETSERTTARRLALALLYLLIFSLALMQPAVPLLGFSIVPTDFIFLATATASLPLLYRGQARPRSDPAYAFVAIYLLAMLVSVPTSESVSTSLVKLLTQAYLAALALAASSLIEDEAQLRAAVRSWLAGWALVGIVAILALVLFAIDPHSSILQFTLSVKGTLPAGNYPRLQMTFLNPNMACNYLTVSLMLALAAGRAEWITEPASAALVLLVLVASIATLSPGLGGIALGLCLWASLSARSRSARAAFLLIGAGAALLFVGAMAVTPFLDPAAPYLIHLPLIDVTVAPAGRLLVWTDALHNFVAHPWTGRGIGVDPVTVTYADASGEIETSTDAHNIFLSIAVQCGVIGLGALLLLIWQMVRRTLPLRAHAAPVDIVRTGLGIGLLIALVYEGLGGSFEDARHLWVALGLLLASARISRAADLPVQVARR